MHRAAVDSGMSDRSTDELLEETERLLEGDAGVDQRDTSGADLDDGTATGVDALDRSASPVTDHEDGAGPDATEASSSWRSRLRPSRPWQGRSYGLDELFSPRAFFGVLLALTAGLLAGGTAIPLAGQWVGLAAVAFLLGLVARRRRYLEVSAAGLSVGSVAVLLDYAVIAIAGSGSAVVIVGATAGLGATLLGYYFGRDLRHGLSRDVE